MIRINELLIHLHVCMFALMYLHIHVYVRWVFLQNTFPTVAHNQKSTHGSECSG